MSDIVLGDVNSGITIKGIAELNDCLRLLNDQIVGKWTNQGLYRAVKAMRGIARNEVPKKTGELSKTIRIGRSQKVDANRRAYFLVAGNRKKGQGWYAHFVERGTQAHVIAAKGGALAFGGGLARFVDHPGAKADPFMQRTLNTGVDAGLRAYIDYMSDKLRQEGLLDPFTEAAKDE